VRDVHNAWSEHDDIYIPGRVRRSSDGSEQRTSFHGVRCPVSHSRFMRCFDDARWRSDTKFIQVSYIIVYICSRLINAVGVMTATRSVRPSLNPVGTPYNGQNSHKLFLHRSISSNLLRHKLAPKCYQIVGQAGWVYLPAVPRLTVSKMLHVSACRVNRSTYVRFLHHNQQLARCYISLLTKCGGLTYKLHRD
jgi:hypothetical protein